MDAEYFLLTLSDSALPIGSVSAAAMIVYMAQKYLKWLTSVASLLTPPVSSQRVFMMTRMAKLMTSCTTQSDLSLTPRSHFYVLHMHNLRDRR